MPPNPPCNAHGFAMRSMSLRDMQIPKYGKKIYWPPPLPNPGDAPELTIKSKVIYAKERMGGDEMSPFINGDRLVYVTPNVSPPLPKETVISGFPCRIWHASQKNYCKRCAQHGHRTADVDICESYDPDAPVVVFRSDSNPLSNYYPCDLLHNGMTFKSLEHYYQYEFCLHAESPEVANQVIAAPSAKVAKELSTDLKKNVTVACLANWSKIRVHII